MKRFKALFMSLVLVTCMLGSSSSVNAATYSTGKAIIPSIYYDQTTMTGVFLSNITDDFIDVTITLYNNSGILVTDDNSSSTGLITGSAQLINYNDNNLDSTLTFRLAAHSTGYFHLNNKLTATGMDYGYGVIKWSQSGSQLQGLVAWACEFTGKSATNEFTSSIKINGVLPF